MRRDDHSIENENRNSPPRDYSRFLLTAYSKRKKGNQKCKLRLTGKSNRKTDSFHCSIMLSTGSSMRTSSMISWGLILGSKTVQSASLESKMAKLLDMS